MLNTIVSFVRVVVNAVVTLIATRIALKVLGAEDFGLYSLLSGTVLLLSFINGALMVSAQRFFSIALGEKDFGKLTRYYNASLSIHIIFGLFLVILLVIIRPFLFGGFFNISSDQIDIGKKIYDIMIVSSAITIMTIPYSAIMNAHEDLIMMACADIVSCLVKLAAAVVILFLDHDLLLIYSLIMLGSAGVKAIIEFVWSKIKYQEVKESWTYMKDISTMKEMFGFVGWNTLGSTAVLVRNQGVALVLNVFFGTVVNTAYGIANQVNSLVLSFASTLTTVFSPIIIKAKGEGNEEKMRSTAIFSSKLSFLLSSMMALPILVFLEPILKIWLGEYPTNTYEFCYFIVLSFLVLQLYPGINRAIYASGKIKGYQIAISIILVSIIPIGILMFRLGFSPYSIILVMLISQIGTLISTLYFGVKHCHFTYKNLIVNTVFRPIAVFIISLLISYLFKAVAMKNIVYDNVGSMIVWLLLGCCVIEAVYIPTYYFIVMNKNEKKTVNNLKQIINEKIHPKVN